MAGRTNSSPYETDALSGSQFSSTVDAVSAILVGGTQPPRRRQLSETPDRCSPPGIETPHDSSTKRENPPYPRHKTDGSLSDGDELGMVHRARMVHPRLDVQPRSEHRLGKTAGNKCRHTVPSTILEHLFYFTVFPATEKMLMVLSKKRKICGRKAKIKKIQMTDTKSTKKKVGQPLPLALKRMAATCFFSSLI